MVVDVDNREVRTAREAARELGSLLAQLGDGTLDKVVIVQQGRLRAVMVSVDEYERLTAG